jgi:hypothetical protein
VGKDTLSLTPEFILASETSAFARIVRKEASLIVGFLFIGLIVMPVAIYFVGQSIFGEYGGHGYGQFFADLSGRIRSGDGAAWFLVLSPYLAWQTLRLMRFGWRLASGPRMPRQ